jgi:hypothetical protein
MVKPAPSEPATSCRYKTAPLRSASVRKRALSEIADLLMTFSGGRSKRTVSQRKFLPVELSAWVEGWIG